MGRYISSPREQGLRSWHRKTLRSEKMRPEKKNGHAAPEAQVSGYAPRRAYFSKPCMYGASGGRDPVLNSGPRVER